MKILDIVQENQLNEYGSIAAWFGRLFGTRGYEVYKAVLQQLVNAGKISGPATRAEAEAIAKTLPPFAQNIIAKNPKILDYAVKEANKIRDPGILRRGAQISAAAFSGAKTGVTKTNSIVKQLIDVAAGAAIVYSLIEPWIDYRDSMNAALKKLEAAPTEQNYQDFLGYKDQELQKAYGRFLGVLATGIVAKIPVAVLSRFFGVISPKLGAWFREKLKTPTRVLGATLMTLANFKPVSEKLAALGASIIGGNGDPNIIQKYAAAGLTALENSIVDIFTTTYEDEAKTIVGAGTAQQGASGQGIRPDTNQAGTTDSSRRDVDSTSEPRDSAASGSAAQNQPRIGDKPDPAKLKPSPRDKWEYYAPGLIQDPVTKQIDFAGERR